MVNNLIKEGKGRDKGWTKPSKKNHNKQLYRAPYLCKEQRLTEVEIPDRRKKLSSTTLVISDVIFIRFPDHELDGPDLLPIPRAMTSFSLCVSY